MELRSCYFCGTVGDALDTHALPRDDEAVRMTLCTDCHAKLDRVLDAVVDGRTDHADAGTDADAADDEDAATGGIGEVTFGDPSAAVPPADDRSDDASTGNGAEREAGDEPADAGGDSTVEDAGDEADAAAEASDEAGEAEHPQGGDPATNGTKGDATDDAPGGLRGLDAGDGGRLDTYRKALRLLRNREFPMERAAVVDLLGTAYDLDRSECDRLLDFAVEKGMLVEEGEELRRP